MNQQNITAYRAAVQRPAPLPKFNPQWWRVARAANLRDAALASNTAIESGGQIMMEDGSKKGGEDGETLIFE